MTYKNRVKMHMAMIGMALHSMKFSYKPSDEEDFTYEFEDPISKIRGHVGLDTLFDSDKLNTLTLTLVGEEMLCDSTLDLDKLEEMFMKDDEMIVCSENGTMEFYFKDISLTDSTSIASIMLHLQSALITTLRVWHYLYNCDDIG